MDVQCIDLKVPLEQPMRPDLGVFIPVFHRWVREQLGDGLLIDVADYRHVFGGPGIVLVGHDGNYSLDMTGGRPGLRYIRKSPVEGGLRGALTQGLQALNSARVRLERDPAFEDPLRFNTRVLEIRINDRLIAPNHADMFTAIQPDLARYFEASIGAGNVSLEHLGDPRETFGVAVRSSEALLPASHLS